MHQVVRDVIRPYAYLKLHSRVKKHSMFNYHQNLRIIFYPYKFFTVSLFSIHSMYSLWIPSLCKIQLTDINPHESHSRIHDSKLICSDALKLRSRFPCTRAFQVIMSICPVSQNLCDKRLKKKEQWMLHWWQCKWMCNSATWRLKINNIQRKLFLITRHCFFRNKVNCGIFNLHF